MYFIRIQEHPEYSAKIKETFGDIKQFSEVVAVKHTGKEKNNPHFHIARKTHLKTPCLRARLVKVFAADKGNQHMSIKSTEDKEYDKIIQYMFHEEDRKSFEVLLGEEQVCAKAREGARNYSKEKSSGNNAIKEGRKRVKTFTEMCVDAALEEFMVGGLLKDGIKKEMVIRFVIKQFGSNRKVFDKFIIHRIYNVVAYHLYREKFMEDMAGEVMMI